MANVPKTVAPGLGGKVAGKTGAVGSGSVDGQAPGTKGGAYDRELVRRAQANDQAAYEELIRRHQQRVFAVASGILRRHEDVEDIAQKGVHQGVFLAETF